MIFELFAALTAFVAGIIAAISGFGIGSLLTPLLSTAYGTKIAVALVAVPHVAATALRFFILRKSIDWHVFLRFGLASAIGGLIGAAISISVTASWLSVVLGILLIIAGSFGFLKSQPRFRGPALLGGVLSGIFGGLVGNQGGIRAAALMNFNLKKETLVAVSTASALLVDTARLPVYFWFNGENILAEWPLLTLLSVAAILGTFAGMKLLHKINEFWFKRILSVLLIALGIFMLVKAI